MMMVHGPGLNNNSHEWSTNTGVVNVDVGVDDNDHDSRNPSFVVLQKGDDAMVLSLSSLSSLSTLQLLL